MDGRRTAMLALGVLPLTWGCGEGAPSDPGTGALLHLSQGSFYPETMPAPNGGPKVASVKLPLDRVAPNDTGRPLGGALEEGSTSALVGLVGDSGYWVVTAGAADVNTPDFPSFDVEMSFGRSLALGEHTLRVQAANAAGQFGEPTLAPLHVLPPDLPSGRFVITLSWDTEADLDLHVVTPDNVEIYARNINSVEPPRPGKPEDPAAFMSGGILDIDSNSQCVIDGRRRENVVYTTLPPSGRYILRVDTFSLCAAPAARWTVTAVLGDAILARAEGTSGPVDAEGTHDRGAGVLAATVRVP